MRGARVSEPLLCDLIAYHCWLIVACGRSIGVRLRLSWYVFSLTIALTAMVGDVLLVLMITYWNDARPSLSEDVVSSGRLFCIACVC